MRKKKYASKLRPKINFKTNLNKILATIKDQIEEPIEDNFENSKPTFQEILADKDQIARNKIDYSSFVQVDWTQINKYSIFDCFHGILFYIFYNSQGKFNVNELEFHFSCANLMDNHLIQRLNPIPKITNLFDFDDLAKEFKSVSMKNPFFGIKFLRIKINPIAYAVRIGVSGNAGYNFSSFQFMGFNDNTQKWEILDERLNVNDLLKSNYFMLYFTKSTKDYFTAFKIIQIDTGSFGFWGFSIKNFEIHGYVQYLPFENVEIFEENENNFENYEQANIYMDMNDFLL